MDNEIIRWNIIMNNGFEVEKCAICRNYLFVDCMMCCNGLDYYCGSVHVLNCGHIYHDHCISKWRQRQEICPICNAEYEALLEYKNFALIEIYLRILRSGEHVDFKEHICNKIRWIPEDHKYWNRITTKCEFWKSKFHEEVSTLIIIYKKRKQLWFPKYICMLVIEFLAKYYALDYLK